MTVISPLNRKRLRRWLAGLGIALAAFLIYAWVEAHLVLVETDLKVPIGGPTAAGAQPAAIQISDLHVRSFGIRERRLAEAIEALRPRVLFVTGDFLDGNPRELEADELARRLAGVRELMTRLVAACDGPVVAVLGNHDSHPSVPELLAELDVTLLRNENMSLDTAAGRLRVVGLDFYELSGKPFDPDLDYFERAAVGDTHALSTSSERRNFYCHYLGMGAHELADYRVSADVWFDDERAGIGLLAASQYPWGDDRFVRVRRYAGPEAWSRMFHLAPHGAELDADEVLAVPELAPNTWWRLHVEVGRRTSAGVRVRAALTRPEELPPATWPLDVLLTGPDAPDRGTFGLWTMGPGRKALDNVRVTALATGAVLHEQDFERNAAGWDLSGCNTMFEQAFAGVAPQETIVVLSHRPSAGPRAASYGAKLILAGDTHGGQIGIPLLGSLLHPKADSAYVDGRYDLPGGAVLYVNRGIGTSYLPLRFLRPPEITKIW